VTTILWGTAAAAVPKTVAFGRVVAIHLPAAVPLPAGWERRLFPAAATIPEVIAALGGGPTVVAPLGVRFGPAAAARLRAADGALVTWEFSAAGAVVTAPAAGYRRHLFLWRGGAAPPRHIPEVLCQL
jgi:hypothetical protein